MSETKKTPTTGGIIGIRNAVKAVYDGEVKAGHKWVDVSEKCLAHWGSDNDNHFVLAMVPSSNRNYNQYQEAKQILDGSLSAQFGADRVKEWRGIKKQITEIIKSVHATLSADDQATVTNPSEITLRVIKYMVERCGHDAYTKYFPQCRKKVKSTVDQNGNRTPEEVVRTGSTAINNKIDDSNLPENVKQAWHAFYKAVHATGLFDTKPNK